MVVHGDGSIVASQLTGSQFDPELSLLSVLLLIVCILTGGDEPEIKIDKLVALMIGSSCWNMTSYMFVTCGVILELLKWPAEF